MGASSFVASQQRSEGNVQRSRTGSNRSVGGISLRKFKFGGISPRCSVSRGIVPRETNFCKSWGGLSRTFPVADSRLTRTFYVVFRGRSSANARRIRSDPWWNKFVPRQSAGFRSGLFYSARKVNLADSAAYLIGPMWT